MSQKPVNSSLFFESPVGSCYDTENIFQIPYRSHYINMSSCSYNLKMKSPWAKLVNNLTTCNTKSEKNVLIDEMISGNRAQIASFLNAQACNLSLIDSDFHEVLEHSDYLLRDGVGLELHLMLRDTKPGMNLNGTDLIPEIIAAVNEANTGQIALYGSRIEYVQAAKEVLAYRGIAVDVMDGFRPDDDYIQQALKDKPRLIVLGMGMPKQEKLSLKLRSALNGTPVLIVNGGAIIDFMAGIYPRAPSWIRRVRLESLYRLSLEPRRLWRRNVGSLKFLQQSISSANSDRKCTHIK